MRRVVEPGVFDLMVGPSSEKSNVVKLTVAETHGETGTGIAPPPCAGGPDP